MTDVWVVRRRSDDQVRLWTLLNESLVQGHVLLLGGAERLVAGGVKANGVIGSEGGTPSSTLRKLSPTWAAALRLPEIEGSRRLFSGSAERLISSIDSPCSVRT